MDWNYAKKYVGISMPIYIPTVLHKFQHKIPARSQDTPHPWNKPVYGKHIQLDTQQRSTLKLNSTDKNLVQSIKDTCLYYYCALEPTMLPAINAIFIWKYATTQDTMAKFNQVLDYESTHPNSTIWYHASDLILMTDTYSSKLFLPAAISHISGHYYFTTHMLDYSNGTPTPNSLILTEFKTLKTMVSSYAEA